MDSPERGALVPLGEGIDLPDPTQLRQQLTESLRTHSARLRKERGVVTGPEDCYDLIRRLAAVQERMGDYSRAFLAVGRSAKDEQEEELASAVGEQDGIPTSNLRVPTAGGDVLLRRDLVNEHEIDIRQVVAVLAAMVADEWHTIGLDRNPPQIQIRPEKFAIEVTLRALELVGAAKPKVTQVRALADTLARRGDDQLAKIARDAIRTTQTYKGIKVERGKT